MHTNEKATAACRAAMAQTDALSWQATHPEDAQSRGDPQERPHAPHRAEMRATFAGRTYVIRYDADDPDWRARALANLDPLSDAAFALRAAPRTTAERADFAAWTEAEMRRLLEDAP